MQLTLSGWETSGLRRLRSDAQAAASASALDAAAVITRWPVLNAANAASDTSRRCADASAMLAWPSLSSSCGSATKHWFAVHQVAALRSLAACASRVSRSHSSSAEPGVKTPQQNTVLKE